MPSSDELSGADPLAYLAHSPARGLSTAPDVDTTFSNTLANERAPHNLPGDGNPNPALVSKAAQFPFAEQGVRDIETSSTPGF
jgi:hypothetical protein